MLNWIKLRCQLHRTNLKQNAINRNRILKKKKKKERKLK